MIAFAVLPVFAVLIAAPTGPEEGCPSARQVTDAMQARFPAFVINPEPSQAPARPDVLRALLDVAGDGTVVRFSLVDVRGETQLRRALPAPGRGRPVSDCIALADTLAAIVERYLGTISYDVPDGGGPAPSAAPASVGTLAPAPTVSAVPVAPLPRATLVVVGLGWHMPTGNQSESGEVEGRMGVEVELTRTAPRAAALLTVGASPSLTGDNLSGGRTATLRRFPLRLGASLKLAAGPGWLEPAVAVGIDLLAVASMSGPDSPTSQSFRFAPGVETAVGYRLKIAGKFHVRPRIAIGVALKSYNAALAGDVVFETPRAQASFGIDTGVLFQ